MKENKKQEKQILQQKKKPINNQNKQTKRKITLLKQTPSNLTFATFFADTQVC